jgi:hypothetical protein
MHKLLGPRGALIACTLVLAVSLLGCGGGQSALAPKVDAISLTFRCSADRLHNTYAHHLSGSLVELERALS